MLYLKRNRKNKNAWIGYLILTVVLIVFLFTIGTKLFTNSILFLVNLTSVFNKDSIPTENSIEIMTNPIITDIDTSTSSASVSFTANAAKNTQVSIFVNDQKQQDFDNKNDLFVKTIELIPGINNIYLVSRNNKNQIKKSRIYSINYIDTPPLITIEIPQENQIFSDNYITIKGKTESDTDIKINDRPVTVDSQGNFNSVYSLNEGSNQIIVIATDIAGNQTEKKLTVIYEKP